MKITKERIVFAMISFKENIYIDLSKSICPYMCCLRELSEFKSDLYSTKKDKNCVLFS